MIPSPPRRAANAAACHAPFMRRGTSSPRLRSRDSSLFPIAQNDSVEIDVPSAIVLKLGFWDFGLGV
jgi:hypothetical protein